MFYRIQSTPGSILRLKYQIIWLTCRKTNPFSKTLQFYCPFHFNRFLWNVRVDRICNPCYLLSVGAIKIIWFYQKLFIPSSFSTSVFETHNPFSLVFLLVFIMFYSICHNHSLIWNDTMQEIDVSVIPSKENYDKAISTNNSPLEDTKTLNNTTQISVTTSEFKTLKCY